MSSLNHMNTGSFSIVLFNLCVLLRVTHYGSRLSFASHSQGNLLIIHCFLLKQFKHNNDSQVSFYVVKRRLTATNRVRPRRAARERSISLLVKLSNLVILMKMVG